MRQVHAWLIGLLAICTGLQAAWAEGADKPNDETQWKSLPYMRETSGSSDMTHPELDMQQRCQRLVDEFMSDRALISEAGRTAAAGPVLRELEDLAAAYPDLQAGVKARFWKVDIHAYCGQRAKVVEECRLVAERYADYPEGVRARVRWAEQCISMGNAGEAARVLEAVRGAGQGAASGPFVDLRYDLLRRLAEAYFRSGNRSACEGAIAAIKDEYPAKQEEITNWQARYLESKNEDVWAKRQVERILAPEHVTQSLDRIAASAESISSQPTVQLSRAGETAPSEPMPASSSPVAAEQPMNASQAEHASWNPAWWALAAAGLVGVVCVTCRRVLRVR